MNIFMLKKKNQKKSRQEINEESRLLKKKRKHKGLASGSRFNQSEENQKSTQKQPQDPRLGSKAPIALVIEESTVKSKPVEIKKEKKTLTHEEELHLLENDAKLERLLDRVESGETLTKAEQNYLDKQLDRIDELLNILGYNEDADEDDNEDKKDDIVSLLKRH